MHLSSTKVLTFDLQPGIQISESHRCGLLGASTNDQETCRPLTSTGNKCSFHTIIRYIISLKKIILTNLLYGKRSVVYVYVNLTWLSGVREVSLTEDSMTHWSINYIVMPVCMPFLVLWLFLARVISFITGLLVLPPYMTSKSLYWAVPIARSAWEIKPKFTGLLQRLGFESVYCMNITRRFLTLPLRRNVPDVYILGFPKCGTTAMAQYLLQHPAISGIDGLPYDPALGKESHFFNGVLGPRTTHSKMLYRSFFPTIVTKWWREVVLRCGTWKCMDACPLNACLPYVADRIKKMSPDAKLIFMVRDPVEAAFSAEIMLRNTGLSLDWSFMEDTQSADPHYAESADDEKYYEDLKELTSPSDALPHDLPERIYERCSSVLYFSKFADRIAPYLSKFPRENIQFVEFREFNAHTKESVESTMEFIGVDPQKYTFKPVAMWSGDRCGRKMHLAVKQKLSEYFAVPNQKLFNIIGKSFPWGAVEGSGEDVETSQQQEGASLRQSV